MYRSNKKFLKYGLTDNILELWLIVSAFRQHFTMDTDELSEETYNAIIITSEKFNHNLTLQFGVLASVCSDDNDYLLKANNLIIEWKSDLVNSINEIFFDTIKPKVSTFESILTNIQHLIENVISIPIVKRKFEF
jgi:hypothetical protein